MIIYSQAPPARPAPEPKDDDDDDPGEEEEETYHVRPSRKRRRRAASVGPPVPSPEAVEAPSSATAEETSAMEEAETSAVASPAQKAQWFDGCTYKCKFCPMECAQYPRIRSVF